MPPRASKGTGGKGKGKVAKHLPQPKGPKGRSKLKRMVLKVGTDRIVLPNKVRVHKGGPDPVMDVSRLIIPHHDSSSSSSAVGPASPAATPLIVLTRPKRNATIRPSPVYLGHPEWGDCVGARGYPTGHRVRAVIGPGVTLTSSSADQRTNMAAVHELNASHADLAALHGGIFIAGHIVNANFHGSGTMSENVMPLTHNANHAQENAADSRIKALLTIAKSQAARSVTTHFYGVAMSVLASDFGPPDGRTDAVFASVPQVVEVRWQFVRWPKDATDPTDATAVDASDPLADVLARNRVPSGGAVRIHNFGGGPDAHPYWSAID